MLSREKHSSSTILDDIINELGLTYDSSVGLLDGEYIGKVPSLSVLLNLNKLLENLSKELEKVENTDSKVLSLLEEDKVEEKNLLRDEEKKRRGSAYLDNDFSRNIKIPKLDSNTKIDTKEQETLNENGTADKKEEVDEPNEIKEALPPEQRGSYSQSNDTRIKNPKSEFVEAQTLSAAAISELGLYSEENQGLETHGKDYLKRKYGVASYPENDLKDMLPGPIPDVDFSSSKPPSNQVQFTTFQSYIESFFRNFTEEDLEFLQEKYVMAPGFDRQSYDPNVTPFMIPKLGTFYADLWTEEDSTLGVKLNSPAFSHPSSNSYSPKGSIESLTDDNLYTEEVSCGPLSSRLLSAILNSYEGKVLENEENEENEPLEDEIATQLNSTDEYRMTSEVNDFYSIEERLKRELKYIGIFTNLPNADEVSKSRIRINGREIRKSGSIIDSDEWIRNKEDDEVCAEIRALQSELKVVTAKNRSRKVQLIKIIEEQLAWQEYYAVLEDLDKQVDQAYMKRLKAHNRKKKLDGTTSQQAFSGMKSLLDKRKRWIENIGSIFKPMELMKRVPTVSRFKDSEDEEDLEDENNNIEPEDSIIQK